MPLSGAERARRYRQKKKQNDEEYANYLTKERARYHKRKERGDVKLVSEMTDREKRGTRRTWRLQKQRQRRKIKDLENLNTPPTSPPGPFPIRLNNHSNRQRVRKDRAKAYREIDKLRNKVTEQKKLIERYRKRLYRQSQRQQDLESPRTKTKYQLKGQRVSEHTRRQLLFHNALLKGFIEKYRQAKSEKAKKTLSHVFRSDMLKKYRLQTMAKKQLKLTQRQLKPDDNSGKEFQRKPRRSRIIQEMKADIESFLCREENSRMKAGKKSTKTQLGMKRQVYLLSDSLKNLHLKFLAENPRRKMSYALFCRLKPFFVRHATHRDRETCLCKRHENLQFKVNKLKQLGYLRTTDMMTLASDVTCNTDKIDCMYRTCECCKTKNTRFDQFIPGEMVEWYEWQTRKVEKPSRNVIDNETRYVSVTSKEKVKGTMQQLVDEFGAELNLCCKHLYNIAHQYKAVRTLKQKLTDKDILLHVDFSENFGCKNASEIQSMHFGASQKQISLHTGVMYSRKGPTSFCTISDNLKHGPSGIWGHLKPILQLAKDENASVENLYVLSDGPKTQYRCRENFFLLTKIPLEMGFKTVNWNFLEAGHGKGAPDGIGAVIKRTADTFVLQGGDITNARDLFTTLSNKELAVKLFLIEDDAITALEECLKAKAVKSVAGTIKIPQVTTYTL